MDAASLYFQLRNLIEEMPDFDSHGWKTPEGQLWLGRASVLVDKSGGGVDAINFNVTASGLSSNVYDLTYASSVQKIKSILYRALARAELAAPAAAQGAFIPVGESFTALAAVTKLISGAKTSVMFIDPYAAENLLIDFAVLAPAHVEIRVLTDQASMKPGLLPAVSRWKEQYGESRPLVARAAPNRSLHDRLIIVDEESAWSVGQSFNALAKRAPTSFVRADTETASLKIKAHDQLWHNAVELLT